MGLLVRSKTWLIPFVFRIWRDWASKTLNNMENISLGDIIPSYERVHLFIPFHNRVIQRIYWMLVHPSSCINISHEIETESVELMIIIIALERFDYRWGVIANCDIIRSTDLIKERGVFSLHLWMCASIIYRVQRYYFQWLSYFQRCGLNTPRSLISSVLRMISLLGIIPHL